MKLSYLTGALALLLIFSSVTDSEAKPRRHKQAKQQIIVCNDRYCTDSPHIGNTATQVAVGTGELVSVARRYMGATARQLGLPARLWCADFLNHVVLPKAGYQGTKSRAAHSFTRYGKRVKGLRVGAIAVLSRRGGGHVGVISGISARGNPIIISGNHGRRVGEAEYPRTRVVAVVIPH